MTCSDLTMIKREIKEIVEKLKPIIGVRADKIWIAYLAADAKQQADLERMLRLLEVKYLNRLQVDDDSIQLPPPSRETAAGKYTIGSVVYNRKNLYPFGLSGQDLLQHTSIFGRTGAGKSNLVFQFLFEFSRNEMPFLVFDWKRNYRDLYQFANISFKTYTLGRQIAPFTFNPLRFPPGTEPSAWARLIVDAISYSYLGGEGSSNILLRAIDQLYRDFGVYDGAVKRWPTLRDLIPILKEMKLKGRASEWMRTVERTLHAACFGQMGKVITSEEQTPIEDLLKENVVLELDALTQNDKKLIIGSLLLWIHHYRMQDGEREILKHVLVIEEAHHILLKSEHTQEPITEIILREIRELGEAIILIDQLPSSLTPTAIANTNCTITMGLKSKDDVSTAANYCLLESKDKWIFGHLPTGMGICKLQSRFYSPFLLKIPHIEVNKGAITDDYVRRIMAGYYADSSPEITDIVQNEGIPTPVKEILTEDEIAFLESILENPIKSTSGRYKMIGFSMRKGNQVKNNLVDTEYIVQEEIITSSGRLMLYGLTRKGREALTSRGYDLTNFPVSLLHAYGVFVIKENYKRMGYKVRLEYGVNGYADLIAEKDGNCICIEFETGKSQSIQNIEKCLASVKCDEVVSVALNERVRQRILTQVKAKKISSRKTLRLELLSDHEK